MENKDLHPDLMQLAARLFDCYKKVDRLFITHDGQAFEREADAEYHSSKLSEKSLVQVFNPKMTEGEIELFKQTEAESRRNGAIDAYKRAFPQLAQMIVHNARNPR